MMRRDLIEAVADELDHDQTSCFCEQPPEGESGVIECRPCQHRRLAKTLREAIKDEVRKR
jgi:DNA-directed RNA polymerase subunit RPC12/RpoP